MDTKQTFKVSPQVAWRKIEDEIVILDLETSNYYSLNGVAARIWEWFQEGKDEDQIVKALEAEYEVDGKSARKDFKAFLSQLKKEKITAAGQ